MAAFVVGALLAGATGWFTTAAAFSWAAFGTSLVLGGLSAALAKKPERSGSGTVSASGRLVTVRQPVAPWQIVVGQRRVGGVVTFINNYSGIDMIITLAGHVSEEIGDIYFDDEIVPLDGAYPNGGGAATGRYAGYVFVHKSLGTEVGQPFGATDSSGTGLVLESGGLWTDAHRQTGRTKIWIRLLPNTDLFPSGVPNITAVVKGVKVYDPRTATTAWSNNPALAVNHFLTNTTYGLGATYADEIDEADLIAAANICDESVALDAGGTETRYTVNGSFDTSETPKRIIEKLLTGMAGKAVAAGDKWHIHAGAYEAPTLTFDEGDLAGAISVQSLVSRRDNANGVKGIFTSPDNKWQPTDFPALASSTYLAEDGQRVWRDIDLSGFVTSGTQAQRLAKIELLRTRQGLSCAGLFKLTAWQAMTGRTIALTNTKFGWSAKPFDVVSSRFVVGDDATLSVELALRETAAAVYAWSTTEEQTVDIAPNTNLPDPFAAVAPTGLAFDEGEYQLKGEGFLTWTASTSPYIEAYQVEYKTSAASTWTVLPRVAATREYITGLTPGDYNFRVKSVNALGVTGAYATTLDVTIAPAVVPVVSGLELFGQGLDTEFVGRDAKFAWRARSYQNTPEFGSETLGASEGRPDPYFKDYKVVIENSDGTVRRTEFVPGTDYTYTYEKNHEDGAGTPVRAFRIKVWQRGQQNQLSAYPAQLLVSNTEPVISGVVVDTSIYDVFKFVYDRPTDVDWSGVRIWASITNGFTPGAANLVYDGVDTNVRLLGVNTSRTYYYRYALRDVFGFATTSEQVTVTNAAPTISGEALSDVRIDGFTFSFVIPTNPNFNGYKVYASASSGFTPGAGNIIYSGAAGGGQTFYGRVNFIAPARAYYVKIIPTDIFGDGTVSSQLTATNAAPTAPTLTLTGIVRGFAFAYTAPASLNFIGAQVHASLVSGFTPSASTVVYDGASIERQITGLEPGLRYYVRCYGKDALGLSSVSAEQSVVTQNNSSTYFGAADGGGITTLRALIDGQASTTVPKCALYCPANDRVYIGSQAYTVIVNPETDAVESVNTGTMADMFRAIVYPVNGYIYCALGSTLPSKVLTVIDPFDNSVVSTHTISDLTNGIGSLFYCPADGYIYIGDRTITGTPTQKLVLWNPATAAAVSTTTLGGNIGPVNRVHAYCPSNNKSYVGNATNLSVITPSTGAVSTTIAIADVVEIAYVPTIDRIVTVSSAGLKTINPATNAVESTVGTIYGGILIYSIANDRIYCLEDLGNATWTVPPVTLAAPLKAFSEIAEFLVGAHAPLVRKIITAGRNSGGTMKIAILST